MDHGTVIEQSRAFEVLDRYVERGGGWLDLSTDPTARRLGSACGRTHHLGDSLLLGLGQRGERVRRGPHAALVQIGYVAEAQRAVAGLELARRLEEHQHLAVLRVCRLAVPRSRRQFWGVLP